MTKLVWDLWGPAATTTPNKFKYLSGMKCASTSTVFITHCSVPSPRPPLLSTTRAGHYCCSAIRPQHRPHTRGQRHELDVRHSQGLTTTRKHHVGAHHRLGLSPPTKIVTTALNLYGARVARAREDDARHA
eukprot:scaffold12781_cov13-Prasinocladus_malaysianus.AAC.1